MLSELFAKRAQDAGIDKESATNIVQWATNIARQAISGKPTFVDLYKKMAGYMADCVVEGYRCGFKAGQRAAFEEAAETCRDHVADISDMINTPTDFHDPIDDCTYAKYDTAVDLSDILRERAAEVGK